MNRLSALVGMLFLLWCAGLALVGRPQPEPVSGEQRAFVASMLIVAAMLAVNAVWLGRTVLQRVRIRRLGRMLGRVRELRAAGRHAEARRLLARFDERWRRYGLDKVRPLTRGPSTGG